MLKIKSFFGFSAILYIRQRLFCTFALVMKQARMKASAQHSSNKFDSAFALHFNCNVRDENSHSTKEPHLLSKRASFSAQKSHTYNVKQAHFEDNWKSFTNRGKIQQQGVEKKTTKTTTTTSTTYSRAEPQRTQSKNKIRKHVFFRFGTNRCFAVPAKTGYTSA